ncbi:hypothetical protein EHQ68_16750 [Leptospira congkakensis]|uniref:Uncharacterized protein n=1 Tax=Leptospira congkakensis TaxID=2484932 RepID=A0A8B5NE28_9LEPT|nr:hypothetical protein [Leptospira congkakensis]TGL85761.1 hypothetical protein EHQ68_16750 [Leptospira congkakensis]TGL97060.1 hypothetical protein EHQ69_00090 [Leptospira congkakensis]
MKIKELIPSIIKNSLHPAIKLDLFIEFDSNTCLPINYYSSIFTIDKKFISNLEMISLFGDNRTNTLSNTLSRGAGIRENLEIFSISFVWRISNIELEYLENLRNEGNLKLNISTSINYLENNFSISNIKYGKIKDLNIDKELLFYEYDANYHPFHTDMNLIAINSNRDFLKSKTDIINHLLEIKSSDWLNDFAPNLGLGNFFVVKIPTNNKTLKNAWNYISNGEKSLLECNYKGVLANCRECISAIDKKVKSNPYYQSNFFFREKWNRKISHYLSLGLHLEDINESPEENHIISRADAHFALFSTKAILNYYEEIRQDLD